MIEKNQTWKLVEKPTNRKIIGVKWVYKAKQNADGSLNKLKARLVVKGFSQKYGLDYFETYAPVARLDTIRLIVGLAAHMQWNVYQLDVKSAFLNGILEEEIYVEQPEGFEVPGKEEMVYRLRKALYGLKQAPRAWYARIDSYLLSLKFERSVSEPTLYVKKNKTEIQLVVSLYVDDLLVTRGDEVDLAEFKIKMKQMFEMTDLGLMTYFLGMEVNQTQGGIFLKQESFALKVLTKFSMLNCKPTPTPVVAGVKLSSHEGHEEHFQAAKRVLRYIKGTLSYGLLFSKAAELRLKGYTDSDWAGSKDDMKSTSGYAFTLGSAMVCWSSKKQSLVAQSTAEAEYVAAASAVNQAIWLRKILADLNLIQEEATEILCDNKSAVAIAKNPVFHGRTKHFDIKLHVIREMEQACEIKLVHCNSENQIADILTKGLGVSRFNKLRKLMGVCSMELKEDKYCDLQHKPQSHQLLACLITPTLELKWSFDVEFDQSILIWHIATEICYNSDLQSDTGIGQYSKESLLISKYLIYLLLFYPRMLPSGIGPIRLRDTEAEARRFFKEIQASSGAKQVNKITKYCRKLLQACRFFKGWPFSSGAHQLMSVENACSKLLQVKTDVDPSKVKGDQSKSVLFDACKLASTLEGISNKKVKWEMIREIWLGMLTYAASQCGGTQHADQLIRGGELLTHVWLLMAHFGITEQVQISKGHAIALLNAK
ncbi:hypothetical protein CXB51_009733 [Gossypium anomalum]|uniref:Reverse transcriptase Ty1/copia-type domain-containing protein n=1 Tax=Gossypium anomalum TaxID=47600 RepID=A0A8J5Z1Z7_9ROSI|nr:hypothetical protein CXB51_009733 [Gossypium anomalum]